MQSTTSRVVLLVVLVVAAVGLFVVLNGSDDDSGSSGNTTSTEANTSTPATTAPAPTASITVKDGEPVGGPADIEVDKGDEVSIQVTTDTDGEVHVHGYEIEKPIKAGQTVTVTFTADIDGGFEVEQHFETNGEETGETQIADLTVQP